MYMYIRCKLSYLLLLYNKYNMNTYVQPLIQNLPEEIKQNHLQLDVVFEGGLFNGSYLAGSLIYLKTLEQQKMITIKKLSGCSIGSITALLYFIDNEEIVINIYKIAYLHFKTNYNVNIFDDVFSLLKQHLPNNVIEKINNRLYISYYNVQTGKRVVKTSYKNVDELFEIIRRSCSFPYVIDNQVYYKHKYIDGLYPFVFKSCSNTNSHVLYLNIHNIDKIPRMISIKNESSNIHRIMEGMLETHLFFMHGFCKTNICSFTDQWNIIECIKHFMFIKFIDITVLFLHKLYVLNKILRKSIDKKGIHIYKIMQHIYIYLLSNYCI